MRIGFLEKLMDGALMPGLTGGAHGDTDPGKIVPKTAAFQWPLSDHATQKYASVGIGNLRLWRPFERAASAVEREKQLQALHASAERQGSPHFALLQGRAYMVCPGSDLEAVLQWDRALDPAYESEAILDVLGYPPHYTRGLGAVQKAVHLFSGIQTKYHPTRDHIPELIPQVRGLEEFVHENLERQVREGERPSLTDFSYAQEVEERLGSGTVTYEWLMSWYHRLALLLTPAPLRNSGIGRYSPGQTWMTHEDFMEREQRMMEGYIDSFREHMAVPTEAGEMGIFALNLMFANGLCPMGLIGSPTKVHGGDMNSDEFAAHEQGHYENIDALRRKLGYWANVVALSRQWLSRARSGARNRRLGSELAHVIYSREMPRCLGDQDFSGRVGQLFRRDHFLLQHLGDPKYLRPLLPPDFNDKKLPAFREFLAAAALSVDLSDNPPS